MALVPWVENSQSGVAKIMRRTGVSDFETANALGEMARRSCKSTRQTRQKF